MNNIKLYLIRHGESNRNLQPDMVGQSADEKLSKRGETQAKLLGRHFNTKGITFDKVFYSPYKRAHDTWKIAQSHFDNPDEFGVVHEFREYSAGDMIDKSRTELYSNIELMRSMNTLGMLFKFPNGESLYEVQQRAVTWLMDIALNPNLRKDNESVALFTHGMVIKTILQYFMQFDQKMTWRINIDNTSVTKLTFKDNVWFINYINNIEHLVND
jgi:broad specificity phosphatase PhoE